MTSFKSRQQHTTIADKSEFGWPAVKEYVEDELADGEVDKKRIHRADYRAESQNSQEQEGFSNK